MNADTSPQPRRYLFALVDGGGTVPPELGAARRLIERGHEVTVLAEQSMFDDVAATGATFRAWAAAPNRLSRREEDDIIKDWECKNPLQLFTRTLDRQFIGPAPEYAADTEAEIAKCRPDLVVSSFFVYGAMVAAEAASIPFDVLMPNIYFLPLPRKPPFGLGLQPATSALGRGRDAVVTKLTAWQWNKGLPRLNELRSKLGLAPVEDFFDQIHHARRHLVMTSEAFDFPADLPAHVRYVGAVLDDPAWAGLDNWTAPVGDDPLVLVAMSSTFQNQLDCLQRVIDGLGTLPVRALVTTGPALDAAPLLAPANVTVVAAAPHSQVLRHASAVITHGGHGTVVRSLAANVPLIVMHHGRDQADNAARVTARGAGLAVKRTAGPSKIAAAVSQVLGDPKFRVGAQQLGEAIRCDAESGRLVAELEDPPVLPVTVGSGSAQSPAGADRATAAEGRSRRVR